MSPTGSHNQSTIFTSKFFFVDIAVHEMKHSYEVVPGLFAINIVDDPCNSAQIAPRFGLVDTSPAGWDNLKTTLSNLNASAPTGTSYRLIFLGRHGEGFHNVAERRFGSEEWNRNKSKLNGDGVIVWGPDPKLTEVGVQQANVAHSAWIAEIARGIPLPESWYSSPFTRAVHTALLTFDGILINTSESSLPRKRPVIKEKLREMNGVHTCDKRSPRSYISKEFPQFDFEPGFSEDDLLWLPDHRETEGEITVRLREALDEIFSEDAATYISITAHGGACRALMRVIGIIPFGMKLGGAAAFVLKVVQEKEAL